MYKILKIIVAVLSLAGIVSLVRIVAAGDDAIKSGESAGLVDPMAWIAYIVLALILVFVLFFVLKNLFTKSAGIKSTLIGVGAFAAILIGSYLVSGSDLPIEYRKGDSFATPGESTMVGAGLVAFYILLLVAVGSILFAGAKKIISK